MFTLYLNNHSVSCLLFILVNCYDTWMIYHYTTIKTVFCIYENLIYAVESWEFSSNKHRIMTGQELKLLLIVFTSLYLIYGHFSAASVTPGYQISSKSTFCVTWFSVHISQKYLPQLQLVKINLVLNSSTITWVKITFKRYPHYLWQHLEVTFNHQLTWLRC